MAFKSSSNSFFSVDGTDISAFVDSLSLSRDVNTLETTNFGSSGNASFIAGIEGLSITGSGSYDSTGDGVMAGTFDGSSVAWDYRPDNTSSAVKYTGNEIAGIVVTHKSNLMPVRKDNKQAAVDAANMRR